jgi:hypothetical protein
MNCSLPPHPQAPRLPVECAEVQQRLGQLLVVEVPVIWVRLEATPASGYVNRCCLSVTLKLLQVERDAWRPLLAAGCGRGRLLGGSVDLRINRSKQFPQAASVLDTCVCAE